MAKIRVWDNLKNEIERGKKGYNVGLTMGFAIVISFNVLLNKILDKKKPKKIETPP